MVFCSGVISSYLSGLNRSPTRTRLWGSGACFACFEGSWALTIDMAPTPIITAQKNRRSMVVLLGELYPNPDPRLCGMWRDFPVSGTPPETPAKTGFQDLILQSGLLAA